MSDWSGRVFLVTGAGGHVGSAVTARLISEGAKVAALDRHAPVSRRASLAVHADLANEAEVELAFEQTEHALGPIWGVVHVAGGWRGGQRVPETSVDVFEAMVSTNLRSSFLVGRASMRRMEGRGGRIALVAAHTAATFTHISGSGAYVASKAGVIALTKVLAVEGAHRGVLANCVAPTTIDTPANRSAMPDANPAGWVPVDEVVQALMTVVSPFSERNGEVILLSR